MSDMSLHDRLIIAADYLPDLGYGRVNVRGKILTLAAELRDTKVTIKIEESCRALGYDVIDRLQSLGVRVFLDAKLSGTPETLEKDGIFLKESPPDFLTVMASSGYDAICRLRDALSPETSLFAVTVPTTMNDRDCQLSFGDTVAATVKRFSLIADQANLNGIICAASDIEYVSSAVNLGKLSFNTCAVRPSWSVVTQDDQKRKTSPQQAFEKGATRIIVGRPVTLAGPNQMGHPQNPHEAVERLFEEIASVSALD